MNVTVSHLSMDVVSEAVFVSALQASERPGAAQVRQVVTRAVREFGVRGCAERVAQEFGDHPDLAVARMRWARGLVEAAFVATPRSSLTLSRSAAGHAA
jgi:hypothetical protein